MTAKILWRNIPLFLGLALMFFGGSGCNPSSSEEGVGLSVTPQDATVAVGETITFAAKGEDSCVDDQAFWISESKGKATVDLKTGVATGVAPGKAIIRAYCDGRKQAGQLSGPTTLTVTAPPAPMITVSPKRSIIAWDGTQMYTATVSNGECDNDTSPMWESSAPEVATIDATSGAATGRTVGRTAIEAACVINGARISDIAELIVTTRPMIEVLPVTVTIDVGDTQTFKATAINAECADPVVWRSEDVGVATINSGTGVARGVTAGVATITASCTGDDGMVLDSNDAFLTVTGTTDPKITVSPATATIGVDGTQTFTATVSDGECDDGTSPMWESSAPEVATIDGTSGAATGEMVGTTTIEAACVVNGALISGTAELTVATITVSPANFIAPSLNAGGGSALTLQYSQVGGQLVSWSSSNELTATVDATTGLVTMVAAGTTTITATDSESSISGATELTVIDGQLSEIALAPWSLDPIDVTVDTTLTFTASATFVGSGAPEVVDVTSGCTWTTDDNTDTVATVDAGVVTGKSVGGPVEIKCTYPLDEAPPEATQSVSVVAAP